MGWNGPFLLQMIQLYIENLETYPLLRRKRKYFVIIFNPSVEMPFIASQSSWDESLEFFYISLLHFLTSYASILLSELGDRVLLISFLDFTLVFILRETLVRDHLELEWFALKLELRATWNVRINVNSENKSTLK